MCHVAIIMLLEGYATGVCRNSDFLVVPNPEKWPIAIGTNTFSHELQLWEGKIFE
jgi:hypothetical protein